MKLTNTIEHLKYGFMAGVISALITNAINSYASLQIDLRAFNEGLKTALKLVTKTANVTLHASDYYPAGGIRLSVDCSSATYGYCILKIRL